MAGRFILALVGLATSTGCFIADWNETHIYNPNWAPHAKFHNGQTMSMGALLGITTLYFLYGPPASSSLPVSQQRSALWTAAWIASLYWTTQFSALFYPGSLAVDPEFGEGQPQVYLVSGFLSMTIVGLWLERKRLQNVAKERVE
ncbi:uncharacterized protein TRUGW13939_04547 [Talaromyces rugulosus]|uniref:Acetyltransferase n=1 Tax=Talaromyces rugulosus TaxID=121627 RepID=A0A7H8QVC2_TALRU|nr:uncharacterized protein TRUGW13939_04547 [Talaromyces rugulosus]QKX57435.1 hypothetical protein TRUGW13939_04547 [Talaromyces rugulosus]